jgi:hypothetical protein
MEGTAHVPIAAVAGSVHRGERPILLVLHEGNGDWQFLDGNHVTPGDLVIVHIHHVFDDHPEVRTLRDLPPEWAAERDSADTHEWRRYSWPDEIRSDQAE